MVTYRVLGSLQVRINGRECTPQASKVRQVLALCLFRPNQIVSIDSIIAELWDDSPPRTAVTTAQTYIYQLRKLLALHGGERLASETIRTTPPGYTVYVTDDQLDFLQFERMVEEGRALLDAGETSPAAILLRQALRVWNGPALTGVEHGRLLQSDVAHLEEMRMLALELRLRAEMRLGYHRELIPELKSLVRTHPYHEWLHAQLMIALQRSGRRGDALSAYREVRRVLSAELGVEPSADLQRVHEKVLKGLYQESALGPHLSEPRAQCISQRGIAQWGIAQRADRRWDVVSPDHVAVWP
jgi:SARP family transcriptional regulator, regulator of embCAB operon